MNNSNSRETVHSESYPYLLVRVYPAVYTLMYQNNQKDIDYLKKVGEAIIQYSEHPFNVCVVESENKAWYLNEQGIYDESHSIPTGGAILSKSDLVNYQPLDFFACEGNQNQILSLFTREIDSKKELEKLSKPLQIWWRNRY